MIAPESYTNLLKQTVEELSDTAKMKGLFHQHRHGDPLPSYGSMPYYWSSEGKAEIEFLLQREDEIIPVEVKAENCVSGRSIVVYNERYQPQNRIRFSFLNLQQNCGMLACPSPLAEWSMKWLLK